MAETETALVPVGFADKVLAQFETDFAPKLHEKLQLYTKVVALVSTLKVTDAASLAEADSWNKELLREKDELEQVRLAGPGALNKLGRAMGLKFKPLFDSLEVGVSNLKREIGNYTIAERKKQEESYQAAVVAHVAGDHASAQMSLELASTAETNAPKGSTVREVWQVERYELGLMTLSTPEHPGLVPDESAINAYLRKLRPDEKPALPGVICKLVPAVSTRRAL